MSKFQRYDWSCGPGAVVNALRHFGKKVNEMEAYSVAGTNKDGTDEKGIIAAIRHFGFSARGYSSKSKAEAWNWLHGSLMHGHVAILCIDAWDHWVVVCGSNNKRVVVVDSNNTEKNKKENGTYGWSKQWLMKKWWNGREKGTEKLYAIAVIKK